jgi:hypothetical protein
LSRTLMLLSAMLFLVMATPAMSQKACPTGYADCDGNKANKCETNIQTNANNCGACGKVCSFPNATSACMNGSCAIASCKSPWVDLDKIAGNGCESTSSGTSCPFDHQSGGVCSYRCPSGTVSMALLPGQTSCPMTINQ